MMQGEVVVDGWKSEAVKEALDLCLACKGCKSDCPVNVDMATYKAEFLSHYYEGRARPRSAYAFGLIDAWAHARLTGAGHSQPAHADAWFAHPWRKRMAGMPPQRTHPDALPRARSAPGSASVPRHLPQGQRVILWADTFNNHFFPDTLAAAVDVLEFAGCEVIVPRSGLCCGRPLYDYGMLDRAVAYLHEILAELRDEIRAGTPMVGLEPSCVAVFRDELINLFPNDMDAVRLSEQTFTLGEFLQRYPAGSAEVETACVAARPLSSQVGHEAGQRSCAVGTPGPGTARCPIPVAVAWRAHSASRTTSTRSRWPWASACCFRPCATRRTIH